MKLRMRDYVTRTFVLLAVVAIPALAHAQGAPTKSGSGSTLLDIDANTKAARVSEYPIDIGSMGSYAISGASGSIGAGMAGNAAIFQFRWSSGSGVALVRKVSMGAGSLGTGFTAGLASCGLVVARSYTVSGSTGSNAIATTGSEGKRRSSHATTAVANGDIRISNTAAATGQTWTLDTSNLATVGPFTVSTAVQTAFIPAGTVLWSPDFAGEWPLVLAQNEGFAVRCTVPATGVWSAVVNVEWTERASFP